MNRRLTALSVLLGALAGPASSAAAEPVPALLVADLDDDDADGVPDGEQPRVPPSPDLLALRGPRGAAPAAIPAGVRLLVDGSPVQPGSAIPANWRSAPSRSARSTAPDGASTWRAPTPRCSARPRTGSATIRSATSTTPTRSGCS